MTLSTDFICRYNVNYENYIIKAIVSLSGQCREKILESCGYDQDGCFAIIDPCRDVEAFLDPSRVPVILEGMRVLKIFPLVACLGSIPVLAQDPDPFGPAEVSTPPIEICPSGQELLESKLEEIVLPEVNFEDVPFFIVLEFLTARSVELDTETLDPAKKGVDFVSFLGEKNDALVTLNSKNVTLGKALRDAAALAGGKIVVARNVVEIVAKSAGPVPEIEIVGEHGGSKGVEEKLVTSILPPFELNNVPLSAALELIGLRAVELDLQEKDLSKKGINLVVEGGGNSFDEPRVSLKFSWISLGDVLKYTAALADHKVVVDEGVVILRPN